MRPAGRTWPTSNADGIASDAAPSRLNTSFAMLGSVSFALFFIIALIPSGVVPLLALRLLEHHVGLADGLRGCCHLPHVLTRETFDNIVVFRAYGDGGSFGWAFTTSFLGEASKVGP